MLVRKSSVALSVDLHHLKQYQCVYKILYLSRNEVDPLCISFSIIFLKMGKIDLGL